MKEYEIFKITDFGTIVATEDTLEDALECARRWSMANIDSDVAVYRINREKIKTFRNGGEVA